MDSYVDQFQAAGGSMVMLAKGNRSKQVTDACNAHGGFYLGSIGGPAARLAQDCIKHVEVLEYEELGMEAVWKIEVEDFPAFIVVDDKGNDFFAEVSKPMAMHHREESRTAVSEKSSAPSDFDDLLAANRTLCRHLRPVGGFDGIAQAGVAIVTCMDSRIDPLGLSGCKPGRRQDLPQPGRPRRPRRARGPRARGCTCSTSTASSSSRTPGAQWPRTPRTSCASAIGELAPGRTPRG